MLRENWSHFKYGKIKAFRTSVALGRAYIWCGSNSYLYSKFLKHQDLRFRVFQSSKNWDFLEIWVQRLGCFQALSLKNWILHKLISYIFPYFPLISYVYIYISIYLSYLSCTRGCLCERVAWLGLALPSTRVLLSLVILPFLHLWDWFSFSTLHNCTSY